MQSSTDLQYSGPERTPVLRHAGLSGETSLLDFQALLGDRTGVPAAAQELLSGFPPRPVQVLLAVVLCTSQMVESRSCG